MLVVPLKFMCSTQWETPVRPGCSSFDPTLYQHHTDASGAVCSSWTITFRPLSSVTCLMGLTARGAAPPLERRQASLPVEWPSVHYRIVGYPCLSGKTPSTCRE